MQEVEVAEEAEREAEVPAVRCGDMGMSVGTAGSGGHAAMKGGRIQTTEGPSGRSVLSPPTSPLQ